MRSSTSSTGRAWESSLREDNLMGLMLAIPVVVAGLLVCGALILLWRSFCEFYVAIFRLSDDLHMLRQQAEAERLVPPRAPPAPPQSSL